MHVRMILAFFAFAILGAGMLAPLTAGAQTAGAALASLAVTGSVTGEDGEGTFVGVASDLAFAAQNGRIVLAGELTGTITDAEGTETTVAQAFAVAVAVRAGAACGELAVDVAAVVVAETGEAIDLQAFTLVTAGAGSGGLLGGLGGLLGGTVCEVTRLLENPLKLRQLVANLNDALEDLTR